MRTKLAILALVLSAGLAGCGGGGGGDTNTAACQPTMRDPDACGPTAVSGPTAGAASLELSLTDAAGARVTQVSPERTGTLRATVRSLSGAAVPNVAVTFITTDKTGSFVPTSGTALTDANGVAQVGLPAGKQVGAFTATASAATGGSAATGSVSYAVSFPTLALGPLAITPATLSAGGNASVGVTVTSNGATYVPPVPVSFTSPCIAAGKASIGPAVLTQNGVATASYSDKGCGVADVITASIAVGDATVTRTGTINVLPAAVGSIKFLTADTTNIALAGTGGFGRQEFSTLTFQVFDSTGNPVSGKSVDFSFADKNATDPNSNATIGGLTLNPSFATSDANGKVVTMITGGTIPTSIRVVATVHDTNLTTLSNILVVSTGVPDQKHFSLATQTGNCEGWDFDQPCSIVTATLGDHFGNPVPDGTAVNFTAEGGVIDASCVTGALPPPGTTPAGQTTNSKVGPGSGTCSVVLRSSSPRPPDSNRPGDPTNPSQKPSARVTVTAYAVGEEDFFDANGNNVCDGCSLDGTPPPSGAEFTLAHDKSPDLFRDDNEDGLWNQGEPCVGPNTDGLCTTAGDRQYNGVLRMPQVPSARTLYVSRSLVQILSGSYPKITFTPSQLSCTIGGTADVQVRVTDENDNIMPAGTTITFGAMFGFDGAAVLPGSLTVNNVVLGIGDKLIIPTYTVAVQCKGSVGKLSATVLTPNGIRTTESISITGN